MMDQNQIKIELLPPRKRTGQVVYPSGYDFVKATHLPSGISVTKENRIQHIAKKEAMEELELLVTLWEE